MIEVSIGKVQITICLLNFQIANSSSSKLLSKIILYSIQLIARKSNFSSVSRKHFEHLKGQHELHTHSDTV